ncbi:MAG: DsbA family protein [Alphaproteobacteria bacterium]|nr:DsbA family protein [Alphaproteobacteria bacterium]MCB9797691.1 DsbA family protein [Alphaproteobacteria bacterium]
MSLLRRVLRPRLLALLTSPGLRSLRRALAEWRRRLSGQPHEVHVYHQVDDPYSHLLAQALLAFRARYAVKLVPHLVGPPDDEAAPERALLEAYARKDAADIAPHLGLRFPPGAPPPAAERVELARRALAKHLGKGDWREAAADIGQRLWEGGDLASLPLASQDAARVATAEGDADRKRHGHYLGGMLRYGGEWYWSVDRLDHLEQRLDALGLRKLDAPPGPSVQRHREGGAPVQPGASPALELEVFLSVRSPYSYLGFARAVDLSRRLPVKVTPRPVLPMVMRGLAVPFVKKLYLVLDAKREAESLGIPFGLIADPVGEPVRRLYSLWPFAREAGRGVELLEAAMRGAWSEALDLSSDAGLRHAIEAAGLSWEDAREHLDAPAWREEVAVNQEELLGMGVWGVPSFRLLGREGEEDFVSWGQDRLWLVEGEARRRLAQGPT